MNYVSRGIYEQAALLMKRRWAEGEGLLLKSGSMEYIIKYAADVIKGRWPEGEAAILEYCNKTAGSSEHLYDYAEQVIQGRWVEAEPMMLSRGSDEALPRLLRYVKEVIRGRWMAAEPYLAKDEATLAAYTRIVIENDRAFKKYKDYLINDLAERVRVDCFQRNSVLPPEVIAHLNNKQRYTNG